MMEHQQSKALTDAEETAKCEIRVKFEKERSESSEDSVQGKSDFESDDEDDSVGVEAEFESALAVLADKVSSVRPRELETLAVDVTPSPTPTSDTHPTTSPSMPPIPTTTNPPFVSPTPSSTPPATVPEPSPVSSTGHGDSQPVSTPNPSPQQHSSNTTPSPPVPPSITPASPSTPVHPSHQRLTVSTSSVAPTRTPTIAPIPTPPPTSSMNVPSTVTTATVSTSTPATPVGPPFVHLLTSEPRTSPQPDSSSGPAVPTTESFIDVDTTINDEAIARVLDEESHSRKLMARRTSNVSDFRISISCISDVFVFQRAIAQGRSRCHFSEVPIVDYVVSNSSKLDSADLFVGNIVMRGNSIDGDKLGDMVPVKILAINDQVE